MRNIFLVAALVGLLATCMVPSAIAQQSATTTLSATVTTILSCTVNTPTIAFGTIASGSSGTGSNTITVITNALNGYTLTVSNDGTPNTGYMTDSSQSIQLTNALGVSIAKGSGTAQPCDLTSATQPVTIDASGSKNNPSGTAYAATYTQSVVDADYPGSYQIMLTYTATSK